MELQGFIVLELPNGSPRVIEAYTAIDAVDAVLGSGDVAIHPQPINDITTLVDSREGRKFKVIVIE